MGKAALVLIGIILLISTAMHIIVSWYQSYAVGTPHADKLRILILIAGALAILAIVLTISRGRGL